MVTITINRAKNKVQPVSERILKPSTDYSMEVSIRKGGVDSFKQNDRIELRGDSSMKMILDALQGLFDKVHLNMNIIVHFGDYPKEKPQEYHFYYCVEDKEDLPFCVPDFVFDAWKVAGIANYTETMTEIIRRSRMPPQSDKLFWIGNVQTHKNRSMFMKIAAAHPDKIEAHDTMVSNKFLGKSVPYISLPDHTHYKYLIDIEGNGYSGRIPFLLATGRVLFIQERRWKSYFHFDLDPYKHFIPVKNDFSDLLQQIDFVESNGEAYYREIAQNALEFAQNNLTYEKAVEVWQQKLVGMRKRNQSYRVQVSKK
ncbi:glycosyl transferase family 90 [Cricetibacter osteomyelitidis]|uniref:Glycosyl transferase family 90 n=1 Tax=Cricetibacter osteomyelitidis TaxID=1521931 RepID=A0A4R2T3K9_9PAST|nr:glycosyl transferase family 90 [Cricetibacter osteomyelitidis]TCP96850.1 glycosyl transferase family 90 [Cricetibacter osteomyelitidis]